MPRAEAEALLQAARQEAEALVAAARQAAEAITDAARAEAETIKETIEADRERAEKAAKQQAEAVLAGAQAMARDIEEEARTAAGQEAAHVLEQARQTGHEAGFDAGRQEALEAGRRLAEDVKALTAGLEAGYETRLERLEGDVIDLALTVARKVLGAAIDREDSFYKALIQNALSQMKRDGKLLIRLSQETAARLFPDGVAVFQLGDQRVTATISADPFMKNHQVTLESDSESVTAGLDSQLAAIAIAFETAAGEE